MVALFRPDATYSRPGYPDLVGHGDITDFYTRRRKFRSGSHALTAVLQDAECVAVHGSFRGELHDGTPMELRFADFFEIGADGRFSRRDTYYFAPLG
jgi:ketosteroid isomerase-like protein